MFGHVQYEHPQLKYEGEKKKSITGQFLRLTKNNDLKQMSNIKQGKIIIMMNGLRSAQNANV